MASPLCADTIAHRAMIGTYLRVGRTCQWAIVAYDTSRQTFRIKSLVTKRTEYLHVDTMHADILAGYMRHATTREYFGDAPLPLDSS